MQIIGGKINPVNTICSYVPTFLSHIIGLWASPNTGQPPHAVEAIPHGRTTYHCLAGIVAYGKTDQGGQDNILSYPWVNCLLFCMRVTQFILFSLFGSKTTSNILHLKNPAQNNLPAHYLSIPM